MRKVNRFVGSLLLLGVGFVGLAALLAFKNASGWLDWLFLAVGMGLLFVARHYYFRLPVVMLDERQKQVPRQPFAPFVAAHRRELSVLAQIGLALSLFRLVGLFFGSNWPGQWAEWILVPGCVSLLSMIPKTPGPTPEWASRVVKVWSYGLGLFALVRAWSYWSNQPIQNGMHIIATGFASLMYGSEALSFAYGASRA